MNIKKLMKNKKGFTLIEIIVVVVILAVLMAVAVPSVLKYMGEADNAKYMSQARGAFIATQANLTKIGTDADGLTADDIKNYKEKSVADLGGTPKVLSVTAYTETNLTVENELKAAAPGTPSTTALTNIKAYKITFDGKTATLLPNGSVTINDATK